MNHERKLILTAIGLFATLSLFVFPSTNMIANAQSNNNTQGLKEDAGKLFVLTQKFNGLVKSSGLNLTLPRDGDLSGKLKELANSSAFKLLSENFKQAVQELKANMTNLGNGSLLGELKQEGGGNLTQLIQKLKELRSNP